jgi:hypothetical protein
MAGENSALGVWSSPHRNAKQSFAEVRAQAELGHEGELENTRRKLQELEALFTKTQRGPAASEHVRELTLRSQRKRTNQFIEEISRFEGWGGSVR